MPRPDRPQIHQEFADIARLLGECSANRFGWCAVKQVAVVLHHRATTGGIDDDGIDAFGLEGGAILLCEAASGWGLAGVVMEGTAADLGRRDPDFATVLLQNPGSGYG